MDGGYLVDGLVGGGEGVWKGLDEVRKEGYIDWLKGVGERRGGYNKWVLFRGLSEWLLVEEGEKGEEFGVGV